MATGRWHRYWHCPGAVFSSSQLSSIGSCLLRKKSRIIWMEYVPMLVTYSHLSISTIETHFSLTGWTSSPVGILWVQTFVWLSLFYSSEICHVYLLIFLLKVFFLILAALEVFNLFIHSLLKLKNHVLLNLFNILLLSSRIQSWIQEAGPHPRWPFGFAQIPKMLA